MNNNLVIENTRRENGFTLLEMLLVLFILTIMLTTIPPLFYSLQQTISTTNFLQQFQEDLYYAQSYAIAHRRTIYYKYDSFKKTYQFSTFVGEVVLKRELSNDVSIQPGSLSQFHFNADGNVNQFGYIYMNIAEKRYRLFISIGRGRFEVYEIPV